MAGLSVAEAGVALGVSRQSVWSYIRNGDIKAVLVMHGLREVARINESEIERFKAAQAAKLRSKNEEGEQAT